MSLFLGVDTSNYTTSVAVYDSENGEIRQKKQLLPVGKGELGLRQSDAVFHHTVRLPELAEALLGEENEKITAVGASVAPRDVKGSYMPCFLVGSGVARCAALASGVPFFGFSHQAGHIAAALWSSGQTELLKRRFIAFHVSGGTTEALLVSPGEDKPFECEIVAQSTDLKAGQAVDRIGVMLGFPFPAGRYVDELSQKSSRVFKIKPSMNGANFSLSGLENKCAAMLQKGETPEDICRFCVEYIYMTLNASAQELIARFGELPLVFSGGVMSNSIISARFKSEYGAYFAQPEFSADNAGGIAYLTFLKEESNKS